MFCCLLLYRIVVLCWSLFVFFSLRVQMGRFGFDAGLIAQKISTLSGGQRSRVAFALLTWQEPHLIIMVRKQLSSSNERKHTDAQHSQQERDVTANILTLCLFFFSFLCSRVSG